MLGGVPIVPLILIGGLSLLLAVWLYYLVSGYISLGLVLSAIPIVLWMRQTTKTDDQRLRQVMMRHGCDSGTDQAARRGAPFPMAH